MLNLLKNEVELLPLISALLVLIVLLPMLPSTMAYYLKDIFDIFSRLASWNCNPGKIDDQLIHMQVALYALFLRLYGMFPCNFISYLRSQYKDKNKPVFVHTIKPMLHTVRMHPSLVTASKDLETTTERWRKMKVHDVIVECERFSLDLVDRCPHDTCQYPTGFRSRSGTTNSTIEPSYQLSDLKSLALLQKPPTSDSRTFFTPSSVFAAPPISESIPTNVMRLQDMPSSGYPPEGTSPPEAAIEATPETTPIRDYHSIPIRQPPTSSNVVRALTSFAVSKPRSSPLAPTSSSGTPSHSQPSSPMRLKDSSGTHGGHATLFTYPSALVRDHGTSLHTKQKVEKLMLERIHISEGFSEDVSKSKCLPPPSSPLRIINPDLTPRQLSPKRIETSLSNDDDEGVSIVSRGSVPTTPKRLSSGRDIFSQDFGDGDGIDERVEEEKEQAQGSPCTAGGLHMPNSKSMNNFAKRVQRLRHHSQCNPEPERIEVSTGSSPGKGSAGAAFSSTTVRRAISCPEMKKTGLSSAKDNIDKPLKETDEEITVEKNGSDSHNGSMEERTYSTNSTQTENFWPYEHLFLAVFPSLESNNEYRASPLPSPAPFKEERSSPSVYDVLDRYLETACHASSDKNSVQYLKDQLQLVHQHLLFERHRREIHAYRNRRLLSDAKSTRLLEECNSALRDTVQLQEKYLDDLRNQLDKNRIDRLEEENKLNRTIQYWEEQCKVLQEECKGLKSANENLVSEASELKNQCAIQDVKITQLSSDVLDAIAEMNVAKQQAKCGEIGRKQLEQVNKELLMLGELQLKYQERLDQVEAKREVQEELNVTKETYREDIRVVNHHLESKISMIDSYRTRLVELEHTMASKEAGILTQKQMLSGLNEQHFEKLEAVESKYQTQSTIYRSLEEKLLDLRQRLDIAEYEKKRALHSPDTSSCHEVNVSTTVGLSPHSSPLSASLASSEGSSVLHEREVKNLQAIVDQKEEYYPDNDGQFASTSTKTD
ncbi:unnamed protein product [Acanthoscelides obtectus]|nr:unnamed protein product [Acanthoscelides obtectus]CAK1683185.1 Hamartin [Acanthoscelides obtectus]